MSKMVSGILARDPKEWPNAFSLVFFVMRIEANAWQCAAVKGWTIAEWDAEYNLKPPAKGKYFEVEIEL